MWQRRGSECGSAVARQCSIPSDLDSDGEEGEGTFTATGPAVTAAVICSAGTTTLQNFFGGAGDQQETWDLIFVCEDGSGGFTAHLEASYTTGEQIVYRGGWRLIEGTDAYLALAGRGRVDSDITEEVWAYILFGTLTLDE